jgi:hypothetical protein
MSRRKCQDFSCGRLNEDDKKSRGDSYAPLYALSLIFPYGSYLGTLANGVWIGNPPEKLKNFRGDHIDWGAGVPDRDFGFGARPPVCLQGGSWRGRRRLGGGPGPGAWTRRGRRPLRLMKHKVNVLLPCPWAWPARPWVRGGGPHGAIMTYPLPTPLTQVDRRSWPASVGFLGRHIPIDSTLDSADNSPINGPLPYPDFR